MTVNKPLLNIDKLLDSAPAADEARKQLRATKSRFADEVEAMRGHVGPDDFLVEPIIVVTIVIDDSSSIASAGNAAAVREGHNATIEALRGSKDAERIIVCCKYLNSAPNAGKVLYPYRKLEDVMLLTEQNYRPNGGTPLYDQMAVALVGAIAKMEEFDTGGMQVSAVTLLVSDSCDEHSDLHDVDSIKLMIDDQVKMERHTLVAIGIANPRSSIDFTAVFTAMGILPNWILTPDADPKAIRRAFSVFSTMTTQTASGQQTAPTKSYGHPSED